jgi:hypothetical protein
MNIITFLLCKEKTFIMSHWSLIKDVSALHALFRGTPKA